jgi:Tfp pilus assembly protein PilX
MTRRISRRTFRRTSRGTALPIVLLISAMMLVTASAWLQTSLSASRATVAAREGVQAFHAADSALLRCSRMLDAALPASGTSNQEPTQWRNKTSFEGSSALAFRPFADWPYARLAPQCLIETWARPGDASNASYLITARGFGVNAGSEAWLQLRVDTSGGARVQHWRRIVARPF